MFSALLFKEKCLAVHVNQMRSLSSNLLFEYLSSVKVVEGTNSICYSYSKSII